MALAELIVGLKIPDTIAITAFHTLEKLGYSRLKKIKREDYYKFDAEGNIEDFKKKISKVDILVNANKNSFKFNIDKGENEVAVLVKDIGDGAKPILKTLQERLGFKNIKKIEKGVLWTLTIDANKEEALKIADEIAKKLLFNGNYQEVVIV